MPNLSKKKVNLQIPETLLASDPALQIVLTQIQDNLQHIGDALFGGEGEGVKTTTALNSQAIEELRTMVRNVADNVNKLTEAVRVLTVSVDAHHKTPHLDIMIKNPKYWILVFVSLGAFHTVYTFAPGLFITLINAIFHTSFPVPVVTN